MTADTTALRKDIRRYLDAKDVLNLLRTAYLKKQIKPQDYTNLSSMTLDGDIDGATKELANVRVWTTISTRETISKR